MQCDRLADDAHGVNVDALLDTYLWHERFDHLKVGALVKLEDMVDHSPQMHMPNKHGCKACLLGKIHHFAFPKDDKVGAPHKLHLIHSDICGRMWVP